MPRSVQDAAQVSVHDGPVASGALHHLHVVGPYQGQGSAPSPSPAAQGVHFRGPQRLIGQAQGCQLAHQRHFGIHLVGIQRAVGQHLGGHF
ncbi:hypothetical protein HNY73_000523 [Argiope bruennichi]|uniref:Uncharacterized protein n=1 Tax=Argiope bruennichi TaxID=94029 RepID=A0A8T0G4C0_ARGBR|nr:hypothetical protein HNY73_000523 [Argiope bruennichi]